MKPILKSLSILLFPCMALGMEGLNDLSKWSLEDLQRQYLVHISDILSEASQKIAGGRPLLVNPETGEVTPQDLPLPDTTIRARITLHHCFGGTVPNAAHGFSFKTNEGVYKPTSYLHVKNDNMCAFLDPLKNFNGELIGGDVEDLYSIDKHIYGTSSLIIIPEHRAEEFSLKNPYYQGTLIIYNPSCLSIHEKVDAVIAEFSKDLPTWRAIRQINLEGMKARDYSSWEAIKYFFKSNLLSCKGHEESVFRGLEHTLRPFTQYWAFPEVYRDTLTSETLYAYSVLVDAQFDLLFKKHLYRLSVPCRNVLQKWRIQTTGWLKTVCEKQQNYENNSGKKNVKEDLYHIFRDSVIASSFSYYLQHLSLKNVQHLAKHLIEKDCPEYGYSLVGERLFMEIFDKLEKGGNLEFSRHQLKELLKFLPSSPKTANHLKALIIHFLEYQDSSEENQQTLYLINNILGKEGQERIWGQSHVWTFKDLLYKGSAYQKILKGVRQSQEDPMEFLYSKIISYEIEQGIKNYRHLENSINQARIKFMKIFLNKNIDSLIGTIFENYMDIFYTMYPEMKKLDLTHAELIYLAEKALAQILLIPGIPYFLHLKGEIDLYQVNKSSYDNRYDRQIERWNDLENILKETPWEKLADMPVKEIYAILGKVRPESLLHLYCNVRNEDQLPHWEHPKSFVRNSLQFFPSLPLIEHILKNVYSLSGKILDFKLKKYKDSLEECVSALKKRQNAVVPYANSETADTYKFLI